MLESEIERYRKRKEYFENYIKYGKYIKEIAQEFFKNNLLGVYIFGSVVKNEFSIGLSDIDIAIVLRKTDTNTIKFKKIIFDKFEYNPFEIHIVDKKLGKTGIKSSLINI